MLAGCDFYACILGSMSHLNGGLYTLFQFTKLLLQNTQSSFIVECNVKDLNIDGPFSTNTASCVSAAMWTLVKLSLESYVNPAN